MHKKEKTKAREKTDEFLHASPPKLFRLSQFTEISFSKLKKRNIQLQT
ncbi:MAG: hypothetical protein MRERC_12c026 [Mycoplasmataceae bacterium RC_NB112A]|nr:MAG: hypothetical protein MRERC_12c026 [Mycoplasmataceae bacterium RC_NB112A]